MNDVFTFWNDQNQVPLMKGGLNDTAGTYGIFDIRNDRFAPLTSLKVKF